MFYNTRRQITAEERVKVGVTSDLIAHLLFHRGLADLALAKDFLEPNYEKGTHDPFLLKDAEKCARRLIQAIKNNERTAIYADYDADGIPGAVIFNDFFKRIGFSNYLIYIPHRHEEGFGLNMGAVRDLASQGVKLLVTVDCGITDVTQISVANDLGMDVIVTDHHEPPQLPSGQSHPAFAIVDHKQIGCEYPDKNLCGSGIVYKIIQGILKIDRFGLKEGMEKWFLDLVGIATLSDMVPLVGENRVFAYYGLSVLRKSPRKGLMQLFRKLKIDQRHLSEDDITFMVTPRINAASRMGVSRDAFNLLATDNDDDAYKYVEHLDKINNERKGVVSSLVKEVKKIVRERHPGVVGSAEKSSTANSESSLPNVIVLGNPDWRPSLLGLVANSCAEEFDRPVFLWGRDGDNIIKGSCRSEGKTDVVRLMRAAPVESFSQFGGHHYSGGFAVSNEEIHYLEERLNDAHNKIFNSSSVVENDKGVTEVTSNSKSIIDMELSIDEVDFGLCADINKLAPFGVGNSKPIFLFRKIIPVGIKMFGKSKDHLELIFKKKDNSRISAISFFGANNKWAKKVKTNGEIDLIASIEKSVYRGREELRLRIVDVFLGPIGLD
jgi:single-stranded-DNA-specific exonuclease